MHGGQTQHSLTLPAPGLMLDAVRIPLTSDFLEDAERFGLCFTCDDCAHFEAASARCRHEWPSELHRAFRYRSTERASLVADVVFCKEFEIA